jgi:hypothetical protein
MIKSVIFLRENTIILQRQYENKYVVENENSKLFV